MYRFSTVLVLAGFAVCVAVSDQAKAINMDFSFTGTDGTVTGQILGLSDNATGPASEVDITGLTGNFLTAPISLPASILASDPALTANTFTVSGGSITDVFFDYTLNTPDPNAIPIGTPTLIQAADFNLENLFPGSPIFGQAALINYVSTRFSDHTENQPLSFYANSQGQVTFSAVPEPASVALLGSALVALAVIGFRRRRRAA